MASLGQKYRQIFQVKIHQQKLSHLLQSFNIKIHKLEQGQRAIQSQISISNILDEVKKYVKEFVKQESTQTLYKFYERIQHCNKDINRIEYSSKVTQKNIREEINGISEKVKILQKTLAYINSNHIANMQSEIENLKSQTSQNKNYIFGNNDKINQINDRISLIGSTLENGQQKIECIQEAIFKINKRVGEVRPGESISNKSEAQRNKNNILIKKSRTTNRKTIHKSFEFKERDQNTNQEEKQKKFDESGIRKKTQVLQNKMVGPAPQNMDNQMQSQKSTQHIAKLSKFSSNNNIDKSMSKPYLNKKSSNHKRGSIRTQQNRQIIDFIEQTSKFKTNENSNQIRRIHQKLIAFQSKHSILEENYFALISKINKLGNLQASVKQKIDQAQKLRVDNNTINEIKLRFKQIQTSMELEQLRYVNHSTYHKQIQSIHKELQQINDKLPKFAKKEQVIAAFNFVENKIKQIVLVLSDKFEEDKMGAINKIQNIRCLTCDRQANLTDMMTSSRKIYKNHPQKNRLSLDRHQNERKMKFQQNQ